MLVAISLLSSAFARWSCHVSRMRLLSDSSQTGLITDYGSGAGLSTLRVGTQLALYASRAVGLRVPHLGSARSRRRAGWRLSTVRASPAASPAAPGVLGAAGTPAQCASTSRSFSSLTGFER